MEGITISLDTCAHTCVFISGIMWAFNFSTRNISHETSTHAQSDRPSRRQQLLSHLGDTKSASRIITYPAESVVIEDDDGIKGDFK